MPVCIPHSPSPVGSNVALCVHIRLGKSPRVAKPNTNGHPVEPQVIPNEAEARQSTEAKQTNPSMDPIENR